MSAKPDVHRGRVLLAAVLIACSLPASVSGQAVTVDTLLSRIYLEVNPQPYTMTADFAADVVLTLTTGRITVKAGGTLRESRAAPGEPRTRKATISRLDIPTLLKPFSATIRKAVTDLIEIEPRPSEILPHHDVFIVEERPEGRYLLGGVRSDIVVETMRRYGQAAAVDNVQARRAVAHWLWSPAKRASIARGGSGPYVLTAEVDEAGLVHQLALAYDWGQVGNRITFVTMNGRTFWKEVISDSATEVGRFGQVAGHMVLQVTNHCVDCPPR